MSTRDVHPRRYESLDGLKANEVRLPRSSVGLRTGRFLVSVSPSGFARALGRYASDMVMRIGPAIVMVALIGSLGAAAPRLRLSTTTSTENSGLLSVLLPPFEKKCGCQVDVIAVGTGKALKLGEAGDVDAVLVHARRL